MLPIHTGLLIFIPHIVCILMYSNVLNVQIFFHLRRREGRSKNVWQQLRMHTLVPSKGYVNGLKCLENHAYSIILWFEMLLHHFMAKSWH